MDESSVPSTKVAIGALVIVASTTAFIWGRRGREGVLAATVHEISTEARQPTLNEALSPTNHVRTVHQEVPLPEEHAPAPLPAKVFRGESNQRTKDRRRRNKVDPVVKHILKGKNGKHTQKPPKPAQERAQPTAPCDDNSSVTTNSRSSSPAMQRPCVPPVIIAPAVDDQVVYSSPGPTASPSRTSAPSPAFQNYDELPASLPSPLYASRSSEFLHIHGTPSSSSEASTSTSDPYAPPTSPPTSVASSTLLRPVSPYIYTTFPPDSDQGHGSWDWDGQSSTSNNATLSPSGRGSTNGLGPKPPRFRSKSKTPRSGGNSPAPGNIPFAAGSRSNSPQPPSSRPEQPEFTFPTLNTYSPLLSPSSPGPSSQRLQTPNTRTPRRSTPSPSPEIGHNGVSAQTEITSLKGALEAARLRAEKSKQAEEKMKQDVDRYSKECEMLKWRWGEDTIAWRRRESELQTQVQHLMIQLQAYGAMFTTNMPISPPHLQIPTPGEGYVSFGQSPTARPRSSHSHTHSNSGGNHQPLPPHRQNSNGFSTHIPVVAQPNGNGAPRPPPFVVQPPPQVRSTPSPNPQLYSVGFTAGGGASTSGSSSVAASVSSGSPDATPSTMWGGAGDRGRQRTRTQMQTKATTAEEDWIVMNGRGTSTLNRDASNLSDALADAILKRPESMRQQGLLSPPLINAALSPNKVAALKNRTKKREKKKRRK